MSTPSHAVRRLGGRLGSVGDGRMPWVTDGSLTLPGGTIGTTWTTPESAAPSPRPPHPSIAVYAEAVEEAARGMPVLSLDHRTGIYTVGDVPMISQPHWLLRQPSTPLVQSTLDGLPYTPQPVLT